MSAPGRGPVAARLLVSGRVQGVGFRWFTRDAARRAGVLGWVRNLPDGRVEAWAQGAPGAVQELLDAVRRGPPAGHVEAVEVSWREPDAGHDAFTIRR